MRTKFVLLGLLSLVGLSACGQPTKYEANQFADSAAVQKQAGDYWKKDGWWSIKPAMRKVVITEFSVQYVTENTSKSGADTLSILGAAEIMGMGKRKRVFEKDFMATLPTTLYAQYVAALEKEGFVVVPMEKVTGDPHFTKLAGANPGGTSGAFARGGLLNGVNRNESYQLTIYPVQGLPVIDDSWFKDGGNAQAEYAIAGDNTADISMRVRLVIGLDDDGRVVLNSGSTVRMIYDFEKGTNAGIAGYWPKGSGVAVSKAAMRDDVPVITSKEFQAFQGDVYQIDSEKYKASLMKMYPAYVQMAAVKLKS